jgi:hypothetical protein
MNDNPVPLVVQRARDEASTVRSWNAPWPRPRRSRRPAPAQGVARLSLAADARYLFRRARRSGKTMSRMPTMTATAQTSRAVP